MKGIITSVKGNQITIQDDQGKEITVVADVKDIKIGDPIFLNGQICKGGS